MALRKSCSGSVLISLFSRGYRRSLRQQPAHEPAE
jgi:hypothetical protein